MLSILKSLVQEFSRNPVIQDALGHLVSETKRHLNTDSCSIYIYDFAQQAFVLRATDGLDPSALGRVVIPKHEGLIGLVGEQEEPLNIIDAHKHPRFKRFDIVREDALRAFVGTPIIHQRQVFGVMTVQQTENRLFTTDEESFLFTLATQVATQLSHLYKLGKLTFDQLHAPRSHLIQGAVGVSGLGMGYSVLERSTHELKNVVVRRQGDARTEISRYRNAVSITKEQVSVIAGSLDGVLADDVKAIFKLYDQLLDANSLGREVEAKIKEGWDSPSALKIVIDGYADRFAAMDDPYMRERAIDIVDLSNRILNNLINSGSDNASAKRPDEITEDFILVVKELTAPVLAEYQSPYLKAVIALNGATNSHGTIVARALGVPTVVGLDDLPLRYFDEQYLLVDGYQGQITVAPDDAAIERFSGLIREEELLLAEASTEESLQSVTLDGQAIELQLNLGISQEFPQDDLLSELNVGLYRTEIPFMSSDKFPSEREQVEIYRGLLSSVPTRWVTMRTLDIGGDKPLSYFPITEENPFLGWRGIRLTLDHPDIFLVQLKAMLRASLGTNNLRILLPMVSSVKEIDESKQLLAQAFSDVQRDANEQGLVLSAPKLGVMVEVPSLLYQIDAVAERVDFLSVGTNDLTQYLLALDRNNSRVSSLYSFYHPAVISALYRLRASANTYELPISVCGEMASEPLGAVILMALGYRQLSMNRYAIGKVKWTIRRIRYDDLDPFLDDLFGCQTTDEVITLTNRFLLDRNLGGFIKPGK